MSDIALSRGMRSNLLALQNTYDMRDRTQTRLATGKRVNNALDNPNNFFTASVLSSRAADISNLLDAIGNSVKTIEAANSGLTSMTKVVETAQATARQALQSAPTQARLLGLKATGGTVTAAVATSLAGTGGFTNSSTVAAGGAGSITVTVGTGTTAQSFNVAITSGMSPAQVATAINAASQTAGFGTIATSGAGVTLANPNGQTITVANATGNSNDTATEIGFASGNRTATGTAAVVDKAAEMALAKTTVLTTAGMGFRNGDTITLDTGTGRQTRLAITATTTVGDLITAINDNSGVTPAVDNVDGTPTIGATSGARALASLTSDGRLLIENTTNDALTITSSNPSALSYLGYGAGNNSVAAGADNATRSNLAKQFGELLTQINGFARDAGFNGVNLLNGDSLQVIFNERQTSSITMTGLRMTTDKDLAISDAKNSFQTDKDVNDALTQLSTAMARLRSTAATFGSNLSVIQVRQNFTKELINTLNTGSDNLTLADVNEESANMLALQTRQQLSTQALSLANQADQGVLRLFG